MALSRQKLLADYKAELAYGHALKARGGSAVDSVMAGEKLAKGRAMIPVDEYIAHWQKGVEVLASDAPIVLEEWNY